MCWFYNIQKENVYNNISDLLAYNPSLYTDESIVFCVNTDSGFGSQLTLLVQLGLYLESINDKIHTLGHFSVNSSAFKYHDSDKNNSFFMYFDYNKEIKINVKYYFVLLNGVINYPFIEPQSVNGLNVDNIEINKKYSNFFKKNFKLQIGDNIIDNVKIIKENTQLPLIGVHMRSLANLKGHPFNRNTDTTTLSILQKLKLILDNTYTLGYNIFLSTDVSDYINLANNLFENTGVKVFYNNFITRIETDNNEPLKHCSGYSDSVDNLSSEHTGFKLGSDIIYDCLSLVSCDYYYVSVSNIAFITSFISHKNNSIHFGFT